MIGVWKAFAFLHPARDMGAGGPTGLKATEIQSYLDLHNITNRESREDYFHFLRHMDNVYLQWYSETQNGERSTNRSRNQK